jgi:iron complex outermembrane receptor protein
MALITFLSLFQAVAARAENGAGLEQLLLLSMDDLMSLKVNISTHSEQTLSRAPSVVSVITAEDIKATDATNLTDILQSVPGIFIRSNLFGFRPQITFRGAAGPHTLVMVNGAPIKDLVWNAGIFWKGLPTSMIERVEIIRGPGSALFGSDASAGVINVITKTAGRIKHSEVGIRAGSFDTQTGWMQHGGNWNGYEISFTADLSHTDGHDPYIAADGQTKQDEAVLLTNPAYLPVSSAPGYAHYGWTGKDIRLSIAKDNWRLLADYMAHDNLEIGLTGAAVLDPLTRGSDSRYDLALLYNNADFAPNWGLNAEFRLHHLAYTSGDGFHERPPGYTDATGTYLNGYINQMRSAERDMNIEVSGLYTGIRQHAVRLGGGHKSDSLYSVEQYLNKGTGPDGNPLPVNGPLVDVSDSPYAFAPEKSRRINYIFLQDVVTLSTDWELTAGARYDHYSDFGGALNPRLALVWQSTDRLTTKLMYGEAFRAPSYLELYAPTAATKPNPSLVPERSQTWDLSFSYIAPKNLKLGLDLYRFTQSDLIAADSTNQFQNMGNNTAHGIELEAQWQATKLLRISGNLTHREESIAFNSAPRHTAYLRADWAFAPNWNWNVQTNWIGKRPLPAGDARAPLNAYTLVDTTIRYFHHGNWELAASIRNLFDVDAREYSSASLPNNLPLPGRSFFAELTHRF